MQSADFWVLDTDAKVSSLLQLCVQVSAAAEWCVRASVSTVKTCTITVHSNIAAQHQQPTHDIVLRKHSHSKHTDADACRCSAAVVRPTRCAFQWRMMRSCHKQSSAGLQDRQQWRLRRQQASAQAARSQHAVRAVATDVLQSGMQLFVSEPQCCLTCCSWSCRGGAHELALHTMAHQAVICRHASSRCRGSA
jgi:hypothetical protein